MQCIKKYIYIYILGTLCPLFWVLNPPKEGRDSIPKKGSFGFPVYMYMSKNMGFSNRIVFILKTFDHGDNRVTEWSDSLRLLQDSG